MPLGLSNPNLIIHCSPRFSGASFATLLVYVDDIILPGPSLDILASFKVLFNSKFKLKDGELKYFSGLEIARSSTGLVISQRQYTLQILEETGYLGNKPVQVAMNPKA